MSDEILISEYVIYIEGGLWGNKWVTVVVDFKEVAYEIFPPKINIEVLDSDFIDHLTKALKEADDLAKKILTNN